MGHLLCNLRCLPSLEFLKEKHRNLICWVGFLIEINWTLRINMIGFKIFLSTLINLRIYSSTQRTDDNGRKEKTTTLNQQQPLAGLFPWPAIVHTVETVPIIWSQKQCHSWKCPLYFYCSINYGFIPLFDFGCFRESHGDQIDFMPLGRVTNNNMKIALFVVWIIALLCRAYSVF